MAWLNIRAPARLHLGFIPGSESAAQRGSAAVAISEPELRLRMRKSGGIRVTGAYSDEFFSLARRFLAEYAPDRGVEMLVESGIRRHTGLGSGTRMALSMGMGISRLYGLDIDPYEMAEFFGRGRNSKAGLETLLKGGFVIAFGETSLSVIPPEDWVFVVAVPNVRHGFFGDKERQVMRELEDFVEAEKDVTNLLIDGIRKGDINGAGEALNMLDDLTGERFAPTQHGKYTETVMGKAVSYGKSMGAYGAGQSSWGLPVYFLTREEKAEELKRKMLGFLGRNGGGYAYSAGIPVKGICMDEEEDIMHVPGPMEESRILYKS